MICTEAMSFMVARFWWKQGFASQTSDMLLSNGTAHVQLACGSRSTGDFGQSMLFQCHEKPLICRLSLEEMRQVPIATSPWNARELRVFLFGAHGVLYWILGGSLVVQENKASHRSARTFIKQNCPLSALSFSNLDFDVEMRTVNVIKIYDSPNVCRHENAVPLYAFYYRDRLYMVAVGVEEAGNVTGSLTKGGKTELGVLEKIAGQQVSRSPTIMTCTKNGRIFRTATAAVFVDQQSGNLEGQLSSESERSLYVSFYDKSAGSPSGKPGDSVICRFPFFTLPGQGQEKTVCIYLLSSACMSNKKKYIMHRSQWYGSYLSTGRWLEWHSTRILPRHHVSWTF